MARRSISRRDWPRGLRQRRPGYFSWVHPDGRELPIGRVPFAVARNEAMQANAFVASQRPGLLDRITGAANTMAMLLGQMPIAAAANTAKSHRSADKIIVAAIGGVACHELTVAHCASVLQPVVAAGQLRWAQALRSRMVAACRRGQELGWLDHNPAAVTRAPAAPTRRERLTLEQFGAIMAKAHEVAEWLPKAMLLALVSAQDRDTLCKMRRSQVADGMLLVHRGKTAASMRPVAIPLALRLQVIGMSLADVLAMPISAGVLSPYVLHHGRAYPNAPAGAPLFRDRVSKAFSAARALAGIGGEHPPTFHELRSLSLRLYRAQGGVDTKALASHSQDRTHALYQDARGAEPVVVRIA